MFPLRLALAVCLVTTAAFAQDASPSAAPATAPSPAMPPMPSPVKEHEWLKQFEGEWTWTSETPAGEGQPAVKCEGRESSKMLGGFWLNTEGVGQYGSETAHSRTTLGYDPQKKTYIGTVVVSMDSTLWVYSSGEVDATGKKLSLHCEGPNVMTMDPTSHVKYLETHEFKDADTRVFTSSIEQADGKLQPIMTVNYSRVK